MAGKLGKLPARHDRRDLVYASYAATTLHAPRTVKANLRAFSDWGMLGNDSVGDCVLAGGDHETMLWDKLGGKQVEFGPQDAIADYSAITGYDPNDPSTDRGTDVHNALNYRRKVGLRDAHGERHKLGGFVALEPGNTTHVREAVWLFAAVGIGFEVPGSAMQQFDDGKPWTVVPGQRIEGGHYVPVIGYGPRSLYCVTWGRVQEMSWGFFEKYCDEAYALLSPEMLVGGRSVAGFSLRQLKADLAKLA